MNSKKIKKLTVLLIPVLLIILYSCSASTSINGSWKKSAYAGKKFNKIMIVAIHKELVVRSIVEKAIVSRFKENKIQSSSGSEVIDFDKLQKGDDGKLTDQSKEYLKTLFKNNNTDGVLVLALKDVKESEHYVPGTVTYTPYMGYYSFYGFYNANYSMMTTPGYYEKTTQVFLVSNLYDAASEELLWSAQSETYNPSTLKEFASSYANGVVTEMLESGVVRK